MNASRRPYFAHSITTNRIHTFASEQAAIDFAAEQARASFCTPEWSVWQRADHRAIDQCDACVALVNAKGVARRGPGA